MPEQEANQREPDDDTGVEDEIVDPRTRGRDAAAAGIMPLGDHLEDLRRRIVLGLIGLAPIVAGALFFGRQVLDWLSEPLRQELRKAGQPPVLIQTGVLEAFAAYMQLSLVAAVLVGSPWLLYQLWRFVSPGLYPGERRFVHLLVPLSALLTAAGAAFMYLVVLPVVLAFFIDFGTGLGSTKTAVVAAMPEGVTLPDVPMLEGDPPDPELGQMWINTLEQQIRFALPGRRGEEVRVLGAPLVSTAGVVPQLRVREYLGTVLNLALAFSIAFQTPVVVLLLGWARVVDRPLLGRIRKPVGMACVVAAAVLTPADPLSMTLLAVPLYFLYEFGMLLLIVFPPGGYRVKRRAGDEEEDDSA